MYQDWVVGETGPESHFSISVEQAVVIATKRQREKGEEGEVMSDLENRGTWERV